MRRFGLLAAFVLAGVLSFSGVVMAATNTDGIDPGTLATAPATNGDNGTGYNSPTTPVVHYDSPTNEKIHSSYSKTSDACASCHNVHTALNGMLLQWEDPQVACWSCHDGTLDSTYDVASGTHNSNVLNSGGLFGGTGTGVSTHGMTPKESGALKTAAAPGGAEIATLADGTTANKDKNGNWDTEFTCIACHDPHGTNGNSRVLNPNVNGWAEQNKVVKGALKTADSGFTFTLDIADSKNITPNTKGTNAQLNTFWNGGHSFKMKVYNGSTDVSSSATIDYVNQKITFATAQTGSLTVDYWPALVVKMEIVDPLKVTETVKYLSGINAYCGACHTDYNNEGKTEGTNGVGGAHEEALGDYRAAHRHSVGFGRSGVVNADSTDDVYPGLKFDTSNPSKGSRTATANCLTCHYSHGVSDEFIQNNLKGNTYFVPSQLVTYDAERSSALKRLPNMGVCQSCHNKQ